MRSYIKIYGPSILDALKALKKVAIDMPEVCIMDIQIEVAAGTNPLDDETAIQQYFVNQDIGVLPTERCGTIISKSGQRVGEYDFYFEWFDPKGPSPAMLNDLIRQIDAALAPTGCKYTNNQINSCRN